MEQQLKNELIKAQKAIQSTIKYTDPYNPAELFKICDSLQAFQIYFLAPKIEAEQKFRELVSALEGGGKSHAGAESYAKTSPEYRDYRFIEGVSRAIDEKIKLVKKFSQLLNEEKQNY